MEECECFVIIHEKNACIVQKDTDCAKGENILQYDYSGVIKSPYVIGNCSAFPITKNAPRGYALARKEDVRCDHARRKNAIKHPL